MTTRAYRGRAGQNRKGFLLERGNRRKDTSKLWVVEEDWVTNAGGRRFAAYTRAAQEKESWASRGAACCAPTGNRALLYAI